MQPSISCRECGSFTVRIIFIDLSSVFDTIQPLLLREKLQEMSVNTAIIVWITDYLTDRPQCINSTRDIPVRRGTFTGFQCNSRSSHLQKWCRLDTWPVFILEQDVVVNEFKYLQQAEIKDQHRGCAHEEDEQTLFVKDTRMLKSVQQSDEDRFCHGCRKCSIIAVFCQGSNTGAGDIIRVNKLIGKAGSVIGHSWSCAGEELRICTTYWTGSGAPNRLTLHQRHKDRRNLSYHNFL